MPNFRELLIVFLALPVAAQAASNILSAPVPPEMRSTAFTVTVNGRPVDVAHAAASLDWVSFDISGPVEIAVTAEQPGFWDRGVDIEPWRMGIRPVRQGQTIRFRLSEPAKLSISRPRDFLNHAAMLYLFAGTPPPPVPEGSNVTVIQAGIHRQSLNPKSGETIYLAPGSFVFGSLNLWRVENVKILGRGTIVYEGSQNPNDDEGWMQKPDWHCIGSLEAKNVEIDGLTCIVRARTWSIQMKDSFGFVFDDLRVIGGNPGNANQDGMDWLGGGDSIVRDAFIRSSDDDFAVVGNWDGYSNEDMRRPGHDVNNILIERSVLSTSISNVVRLGWPGKTFNSRGFTLRDSDILHGGIGACGQTFALLGAWGANGAKGDHADLTFENLFLDNWYSLAQLEQEEPSLHGLIFRNIWALDQPPLAASSIVGPVTGVSFENIKTGQNVADSDADLPLVTSAGAPAPQFLPARGPAARFTFAPQVFAPNQKVVFTAQAVPHARYTWLFGDGTKAHGRHVTHRFTDAEGTELNGGATGAGRFRVLLHVQMPLQKQTSAQQSTMASSPTPYATVAAEPLLSRQDWASQGVVAVAKWHSPADSAAATSPGLVWKIYPGEWTELPDLTEEKAVLSGDSLGLHAEARGFTRYAAAWDGYIDIPADGGYTFHLIDRDGARLSIDGVEVAKTGPPFAQVCGSPGNALRYDRGSIGLRAGKHALHVEGLHTLSADEPQLLWEGPALPLIAVPPAAFFRVRQDGAAR